LERFDPNSYLYITKAMDYFDLEQQHGPLHQAFSKTRCEFLVQSFDSDWLFPPSNSQHIVDALRAAGKSVLWNDLSSPFGHDAFLLESELMTPHIHTFLHT